MPGPQAYVYENTPEQRELVLRKICEDVLDRHAQGGGTIKEILAHSITASVCALVEADKPVGQVVDAVEDFLDVYLRLIVAWHATTQN